MKPYIGSKILLAEPLTLGQYNQRRGWTIPADENPARLGYFLKYPDGYVSWTPKEVFDEAYRPVNPGEAAFMSVAKISPDFRKRLEDERDELFDRVQKLDNFISDNPLFKTLSERQQGLMLDQFAAMQNYYGALSDRITDIGPVEAPEPVALESADDGEILDVRETRVIADDEPLEFE